MPKFCFLIVIVGSFILSCMTSVMILNFIFVEWCWWKYAHACSWERSMITFLLQEVLSYHVLFEFMVIFSFIIFRLGEPTSNLATHWRWNPRELCRGVTLLATCITEPGYSVKWARPGSSPCDALCRDLGTVSSEQDRAVASPTCLALKGFVVVYSDLSINQISW